MKSFHSPFHHSHFSTAGAPLEYAHHRARGLGEQIHATWKKFIDWVTADFFIEQNDPEVTGVLREDISVVLSRIGHLLETSPLVDTATMEDFKRSGLIKELPRYLETVGTRMEQLKALVGRHDFDEVRKTLHALIGPAGMIGAFALSAYAEQLDTQVRQQARWPQEAYWLETLERLYAMTQQALRGHFV